MSHDPKPGPMRRKHTNSKLGCVNCKRKKIRCDENLPQCNNCVRAKKDQCSYLTLSQSEINKIKLTHSLRNSQNKLLDSDYRLPTSKGGLYSKSKISKLPPESKKTFHDLGIEFAHELTKLPIRIPSYNYPPLQYKISTMDDFSSEFQVIYDTPEPEKLASEPVSRSTTPLPSATTAYTTFKRLTKSKFLRSNNTGMNPVDSHHISALVSTKNHQKTILHDLMVCLGRCIVLSSKKNDTPQDSAFAALSRTCFEEHSRCLTGLKKSIAEFYRNLNQTPAKRSDEFKDHLQFMTTLLYYCNNFLSYCVMLLDFSMENYQKISSDSYKIFEAYLNRTKEIGKYTHSGIIQSITKQLQYQLLLVKIPTYNSAHVEEITQNLESVSSIFDKITSTNPDFVNLKKGYQSLVQFCVDEYNPLTTKAGTDGRLINWRVHDIYNLMKKWLFVVASGRFSPRALNNPTDKEDLLIKDLSSVLQTYYFVIGASLKTCFPLAVYLFGVAFSPLEPDMNKERFTISLKDSDFREMLGTQGMTSNIKNNDISDFLQRQNYFNLRVWSFFGFRFRIYLENSHWGVDMPQSSERFNDRVFRYVKENPITRFNSTLIRPEHYPTSTYDQGFSSIGQTNKGHQFLRHDESMMLKFYSRNIETLRFFSRDYVLQFDFESMCLLRDYRPLVTPATTVLDTLSAEDLQYYSEDRRLVVKEFK